MIVTRMRRNNFKPLLRKNVDIPRLLEDDRACKYRMNLRPLSCDLSDARLSNGSGIACLRDTIVSDTETCASPRAEKRSHSS
jgi:hypothetical protein